MQKIIPNYLLSFFILIISLLSFIKSEDDLFHLLSNQSLYYEEKYFRFLSNNYETIDQGNSWSILTDEAGIGFKATKDFGSAIILKDWSMYNFKLTKIVFRPYCTIALEGDNSACNAEMWLYHTKDNVYYPPGRRIHLKANFFVLIVPFKKVDNNHPSIDSLFYFFNLEKFMNEIIGRRQGALVKEISPIKSIKLHQIIQNQPSFLFEGKITNNSPDYLFMVFSQYHFISENDFNHLYNTYYKIYYNETKNFTILKEEGKEYYRNSWNPDEIMPKATLMSYNNSNYLKNIFVIAISLFFLIL